jgi:hypothetical protein
LFGQKIKTKNVMEPEHKVTPQQIFLSLGLMAAVFVFAGMRNTNVRTEASYADPLYEVCKMGCAAQEASEKFVCDNYPGVKCDIAESATHACKIWYDENHCDSVLSSKSSFKGLSDGGAFYSQSADLGSSYYSAMTQGTSPSGANVANFYNAPVSAGTPSTNPSFHSPMPSYTQSSQSANPSIASVGG